MAGELRIPIYKRSKFWAMAGKEPTPDSYVVIEQNDARSVGQCMRDVFAAYLSDAEARHELLGMTFRPADLEAVLRDDPSIMDRYQARVRELISDPKKALGEWVEGMIRNFKENGRIEELPLYLGLELLVEKGVDPKGDGFVYKLFTGIVDGWSPFKIIFTLSQAPQEAGLVAEGIEAMLGVSGEEYTLESAFALGENVREFCNRVGLQSVIISEEGHVGYDDSLISNDRIVSVLREEIARRAREEFKRYVMKD